MVNHAFEPTVVLKAGYQQNRKNIKKSAKYDNAQQNPLRETNS